MGGYGMKVWFEHDAQEHMSDFETLRVLPILDKLGRQHIVRWGANRYDDRRFIRGQWAGFDFLKRLGAIWVPVPILRYEERTAYRGPLTVELDEPLAGAMFRFPEAGVRVYLVDSDRPGETVVVPQRFNEILEKIQR